MTRSEVINKLAPHMAELRQMGVSSLALFGSAARGESGAGSDLDLLIAFDRTISLFHFLKVQHRLEEILEIPKVDLVERGALHPALRDIFSPRPSMFPRLRRHRISDILKPSRGSGFTLRV